MRFESSAVLCRFCLGFSSCGKEDMNPLLRPMLRDISLVLESGTSFMAKFELPEGDELEEQSSLSLVEEGGASMVVAELARL